MREIELTRGKVALVDDEDYYSLICFSWQAEFDGYNWYAKRGINNKQPKKVTTIRMHKQLMNPPIGMKVDHIDNDGLNCQKHNLRICTHAQNMTNRVRRNKGLSKYKGVSISTTTQRGKKYIYWQAQIAHNNVSYYIGKFKTEENAATAYNIFAEKHHGEFANYNHPIL